MTNLYLGDPAGIREAERIFRGRCTDCHWSPLRAPVLFQTELSDEKFLETVISERQGTRGNKDEPQKRKVWFVPVASVMGFSYLK